MSWEIEKNSFCLLTAAFISIGFMNTYKRFIKSIKEHKTHIIKKPRQIELWVNGYMSFNSVVSFVGFLTETYYYGARLIINLVAVSIGYIFASLILQPFFYDMGVKTPYEYLEKRYKNRVIVRVIVAFVAIIFHISFTTLFLWSNATILSTLFPELKLWQSIVIIGSVSCAFAITGGLLQSLYVNIAQFTLFLFGILSSLIISMASNKVSLSDLWQIASENGRLNYVVTSNDLRVRYTIWNQLFSLPIPWCAFHGLLIPNVSRYKQIKTKNRSRFFIISNLPILFIVNSLAIFGGVFAFTTFYPCDPYMSNKLENKNQIASYWLLYELNKVMPSVGGLCLSAMLVYALLQHSFGMSLSIQILETDILNQTLFKKYIKLTVLQINFLKIALITLTTILSILYAISFQYVRNSILSLFFLFNNSINSPILAIFLLSMFNPYANHFGALASFLITLIINFWLGISAVTTNLRSQEFQALTYGCSNDTEIRFINNNTYYTENETLHYLYSISAIWYCLFSLLFILIFGSLFSLIYSLIMKKQFDFDADYKNERNKYIFSFKKHLNLNFLKTKHQYDVNNSNNSHNKAKTKHSTRL